jgi:hypothetical protein
MQTFTVSDIAAAAATTDGWPLFLQLAQSMTELHREWVRMTPDGMAGQPGFPHKELDEHREHEANKAQFEVFAALTDFMNTVTPTRA